MTKRKQTGIRVLERQRKQFEQERRDWRIAQDSLAKTAWLRFKIIECLLSEEPIPDLLMQRITEYVASKGEKQHLLKVNAAGELIAPVIICGVAFETVAQMYQTEER